MTLPGTTPRRLSVLAAVVWLPALDSGAAEPAAQLFHLADVRLLPGPFKHAQDLDLNYLLQHEVDRFMAPFRTEAGLAPKAEKYPNWESTGLDGHTAGHYLTALAQFVAATDDPECKQRLDYMVSELAACQEANGNGYVGAIPGHRELWRTVAAGDLQVENFSINGRWVPWYNLHKTFAGLRDAWLLAGNSKAREVLIKLTNWCDQLVANLSEEQMQTMLRAEHGGMNEILADVYAITGEERYLALARRFSHRASLDPLLQHEDQLTGLHANTQIPKVIGYARIAELGAGPSWHDAAAFFWRTVVDNRSVAIGGNSVREHFNPPDDFSSLLASREGPETCNTYNMLRLTEQLFRADPIARYSDYYERALFNHILSTQHPEHGGFVYFTPMRPRHYRVYSQPGQCFWCCVGSGMENHGKYGRFIYAHTADDLFVNLFVASELAWKERGLTVRQETSFPDEPASRLVFSLEDAQSFGLRVRHPAWIPDGELELAVNGRPWPLESTASSYAVIDREWHDGDRVDLRLPMHTAIERLPDGSDYVAVLHGPVVLAAKVGEHDLDGLVADDSRWGHLAPGPFRPLNAAPMLVGDLDRLAESIQPVPGRPLTLSAPDLIRPESYRNLELIPFFRVHDARYMLYWRTATPEAYARVVAQIEAEERNRLALEARTLDQVTPGEQQPEVEHNFQGEGSSTGVHVGRHWRDAAQWFSYDLQTEPGAPVELLVTYFGGERNRNFDIVVNDQVIATVALEGGDPDSFVDVSYAVPADIIAQTDSDRLTVKFIANEGSRAGAVYGLRLLRRTN